MDRSTEENKEICIITYLQLLTQLVRDKDCTTCKYHERKYSEDHSETYCVLHDKCCIKDTCDYYEVCEINELLR